MTPRPYSEETDLHYTNAKYTVECHLLFLGDMQGPKHGQGENEYHYFRCDIDGSIGVRDIGYTQTMCIFDVEVPDGMNRVALPNGHWHKDQKRQS
jgi:hypothetical protein